jgi:hypothetical protein
VGVKAGASVAEVLGVAVSMAGASPTDAATPYRPLAQFFCQSLRLFVVAAVMVYSWDDKEAECYRLYVEEKRSLDEVISYWETRGFTPRYLWFPVQLSPISPQAERVILANAHSRPNSSAGTFLVSRTRHTRTPPSSPVCSSYGSKTIRRGTWWIPSSMRAFRSTTAN